MLSKPEQLEIVKRLLERDDLTDIELEPLAKFEAALERGKDLTMTQLALIGEIGARKDRLDQYRADKRIERPQEAVVQRGPRDEWGFTQCQRENIVRSLQESRHEPTRQAMAGKTDQEIWSIWLKKNGYRSMEDTVHNGQIVYKDRGRRHTSHTPQEVKDAIVADSQKRRGGK